MPLFGEIVVIKRNGTDGTHFPLTATSCLFGRKSECDIRIQLPHVSKEHCKVEVKANKEVFVINISAVNPTQLNGIAIQQPELLKHGDIITIIDRSFRFEQPPTNPHRQSTGGNSLSSKLVEDEPSSIKGKASKLTRKSEGNVSRTTHTRLSLPISPHRRSSREKKDLSPFGELYEMLKNKVHLKQEHAKTPAKQIMENGDCIFTPVTTRRSLGNVKGTRESSLNNTLQFESQELHVESATLSEKTASALKSPSRGRPSTKLKQQRLSGKRDSPAKSVSELPHEEISISFQDNGQKQPNDKLTPRRRRSTSKEQTPVKSGVSVLPLSRNRSPRSASPKDLHVNAQVSKPPQKRRSSELELPEPTPKRKRVSFGGHLSPEFFDKRLPPNSPLQRGATPSRRSLSLAATRVIRKSFGGFKQAVIKETFEPAKRSPGKASPAKRSPGKASPAKRSPAKASPAKMTPAKRSPAKASPAKMTPAKRSPAKASPAKITPAKRSPAKASPAKITPAKRSPAKASPAKITPAKRSPAKASPAKMTPAKRSPAKASPAKMTLAKRSPAKMTLAKQSPAKASPAKMTPAKRSPAKMTPAKRSPAKMTPAKRSPAKMTPAKRSPAKMTPAKRSPAKMTPAKRSPAKMTPAKRSPAKMTPAKRSPAKMTPAKRSPAKMTPAKRSPAKMTPAKMTPAKRSPAKMTPAKRSPAKMTPAKRSPAKMTPAKRSPAKMTPAKRSPARASPAKRSPARASPVKRSPARASPAKMTPAKRSPANVKAAKRSSAKMTPAKFSPAKRSPAKVTPAKKSPATIYSKGRFSISQTDTPPLNYVHVPNTEENELSAQTPRKSRKSISLKKTPGRRSRKLETFEILRSRRRSGATEANLLVAKSWADVVRIGVPKNHKKSEKQAHKAVPTKRKQKPKTPARRFIDRSGTGHADSPATILVGRAHTRTVNPTGYVPKIVQNQAIKIINDQNESFTGMSELFNTPAQVKPRKSGRSGGLQVNTPQALIVDVSLMQTPEELGEMVVSPINGSPSTTRKKQYSRDAVSRLLRSPVSPASPKGIEKISETSKDSELIEKETATLNGNHSVKGGAKPEKKKRETMGLTGVKRIMRTPKQKGKQVIDPVALKKMLRTPKQTQDMVGIKCILKTPKQKGMPVEDMAGIKRIMRTPKVKGNPVEDMTGIKHIMKTPKEKGQPVEDMVGVKRIMRTPKIKGQPVEDMVGIKRIMRTPKEKGQPVEDMEGLSQLMSTPTENTRPIEEIFGMKQLIKTPPKTTLVVRERASGTPPHSSKKAALFQTNQTSAPEEALPKHTTETNNGDVSLQIDSETGKSEKAKRRGRPSRASLNVALDGGKSVENNSTSAQEINMEEASPLHVLATEDTSSTGADKATPAKGRGRPSKGSMSKSPASANRDGGKSVENNSTSAQEINMEEASPLHVLATEDTSSPGTDKATPPKGRGRPSKGSMSKSPASGNGDSEKSEKNSTSSALENHVEESSKEASLQASTTEGASSTDADKTTPAKRRGRPSKHSLSHSPDGGKSVENNSTSAQEINMEEGAPLHVLATEDSSSTGTDKATPAKRRGRPSKGSMSKSPASANRDSEKSEKKSTSSALENHVEESSKEASLQASTTEGASSTDADKTTPAKRRGRPSKSSLSHSPVKPAVDVPEDLSTSNEDSNISELSSDIRTDQQKNVLPNGAKKATKKSQRKNTVTKETVQIAAVLQSEPLENLVVENDEKSAPQRRRGRPQKGGALSSATEVSDGVLAEELTTNRRTGRGRKIAEAAKLQEGLEVCTSAAESQVEVKNEELSSAKSLSKSSSPIKAVPEDSTTTKKLRGRQPKVGRERKAVAEKLLTELPGDSALVNNVTPSVRRGRRARGTANSVTETVIIETNLPDLADTVVLHEEQESSSHTSPEAKTQRGNRKNLKSAVDSVKNSAQTDVTIELKERAGKRPTRGARGTQQVEELKELKGKKADYHIPKNAEPVLLEETLAKEKASKAKSVQWHPLLAAQETAEKHTEETVKNLADEEALVSAIKSRGRRRQEVKETVVPAKRSRSRKEEKSVDTLNSSSVAVDEKSLALVASDKNEMSKTKRGRRQATIQLKKITDPDLPVAEVKNNSDVSSKQDLEPEIVSDKPLNRRNTGKRNLKSSSDSDSGSNAIEPALETMTQKRGRRGAAAKISDSENTEVKTVESAENLPSSKRRGRAPNKKNMPEISNVAAEPAESPENVAEIENTEKIESPPKSRRVLKRKAATTDVSEGNTSVSEKEAPAPVRGSTRGASRQKSAAKEKPVVVEESPAKRKKAVPSSSPTQKRGKTKATAVKRQNEKPAEVVKTRPTLRTRK
ncbi:marker of proliferation Ki-67 S homeolog isoform X13 [Xenopus laevis]|uniref:Marker of proliferation Ki-67 S homeolog isoform X13 n=1 Tax=Xenopus laevis TaxID=8355 RepID=A0A8J1LB98_XENLA|nr:marker of proliferation Ki-67 S homeolog isoform X13 [Xenopus laevis]